MTTMRFTIRSGALALVASAAVAVPAVSQVEVSSKATKITISGRFQTQLATSSCSDFSLTASSTSSACERDVPAVDLFIRRARLTLELDFNDWISGKLEPDFEELDGVQVKDAWGRLNFQPGAEHPHAQVTVGHFKRPFDGFHLTSSTEILTIERDVDIPGVPGPTALSLDELTTRNNLSDRDIGVMLDGGTPDDRFHYWVGAFNGRGPGENEDLNTEKQLVGRAAYKLQVGGHPLELAAAAAVTDVPFTRSDGSLDGRYFGAFELWAELGDFDGGPHVQAGAVFGKNALQTEAGGTPDLEAGDPLASMVTWQAIGSYKLDVDGGYFLEAIEPVFRVTMANPNTDLPDDTVWGFTPGVQIFFAGRNKLALNWDIAVFGDDSLDTESSFKAQYQFHY